jgi:hypothetical protein
VVWRSIPVLVTLLAATACAGDDAVRPVSVTTPFTGPARSLAPSQLSHPTVAPPPAPGRCDQAALHVAAALGDGGAGDPAVVVTFVNAGSVECEVDLGTEWAITHGVEPSVWLAPGASADLWGDGSDCESEVPEWPLQVNGILQFVDLPAGAPCDVVPTAFFPA